MPRRTRRTAWLALLLSANLPAAADLTVPAGVGPSAQEQVLTVVRGQAIDVPLIAAARGGPLVLEYSIFEEPKFGVLGPIRTRQGLRGALVSYRPDPRSAVARDQFRFRARIPNGEYSAPTVISLRIVEPRPLLQVPKQIDFGRIPVRGRTTLEIPIVNRGTGPFRETLSLPAPFHLDGGEAVLNIPPGGEARVLVTFAPQKPEPVEHTWALQGESPGGRVVLKGRPFAPFEVSARHFGLELDRANGERLARVGLVNPGAETVTVVVKASERFVVEPAELQLDPGARGEIAFRVPPGDVAAVDEQVEFITPDHAARVALTAPITPARLRVVEPADARLSFEGEYGDVLGGEVTVRNDGGETVFVSAVVAPPFAVLEGSDGVELAPGASCTFHLELEPDRIGPIDDILEIASGLRPIEIELTGNITLKPGSPAPPRPAPSALDREERLAAARTSRFEQIFGRSEVDRKLGPTIPTVDSIKLVETGRRSLTLAWFHPPGGEWDYVIETQVYRPDEKSGFPRRTWVELGPEYAAVTTDQRGARAEVKGLEPGGRYTLRVLTRGGNDTFSRPGLLHLFTTEQPRGFFWWFSWPLLAILSGVVALALFTWQRMRYHRELYG